MSAKLLVVDGHALVYRAYYGIKALTDPKGRPVNAVYGFAGTLLNLWKTYQPEFATVVFDTPAPTHRHQLYPEYKAQRQAMPEDLRTQLPLIQTLVKSLGFKVLEAPGWEADDLMGTLAARAQADKLETLLFTTDKDAFQLVSEHVAVLRPVRGGKGENEVLDAAGVERFFGVRPDQVVDLLALMGDVSDNVPGVPGVGEKTALDLIHSFGSLDAVFTSLDKIAKPKLRENLKTNHDQALLAKQLLAIVQNMPLELTWEQCRLPAEIPQAALGQLAELGFKRLLLALPRQTAAAPQADWVRGLTDDAPLAEVVAAARAQKMLAIEVLPKGLALAARATAAAVIPLQNESLLATVLAGGEWLELLADPGITKVGYDLKPLMAALLRAGFTWAGPCEDLHLAAHFLDLPANRPTDFITRLLGGPPPEEHPAFLACATLLLAKTLTHRLKTVAAEGVYRDVELPLLPVLAALEAGGVSIDSKALEDMAVRLGLQMQTLEKNIQTEAGVEFNIRSTQQLAEVLFDRLQLSRGKKTKTGHSTSVEVLEALAAEHPLPAMVLEFRQLQKLKSTYLDVLPGLVDPADHRLHTTFHQVGAATGRLSSSDPNLQNIPVRTDLGRELRRAFVPAGRGLALLSADYSQIELRLLAHLSEDQQMLEDFAANRDIHTATAAELFHVPVTEVTVEMRRQAKTCNFGIAYGVSPYGLARQLGISPARGKEFIDHFYLRYPGVRQYLDSLIAAARQDGYVSTLLGRRRTLPEINSANRNIREAAERMAINTPIQGSAADLIKVAMIRLAAALPEKNFKSRMILQVHDELVLEGPEPEMPALKKIVVEIMSQVHPLKVTLAVEAGWGPNWLEAHA
ncbi:MAG: DNA polymerase I [Candidatus Firestonebacteria bacterium]|nr:DNA polymerase I [Candidatus Firestonebacteria bacterium]